MIGMSRLVGAMGSLGGGLRRAGIGAAIGGVMGGMSDNGSFAGGALGGAIGGALMGKRATSLLGNIPFARGGQMGMRGIGFAARGLANRGAQMARGTGLGATAGFGMLKAGIMGQRGAGAAAGFLGRNSASVNRYGGYALGALGVASAASIGSSVLSSNRGY